MKMKLVSLSDWGNHNAFTNKEHQYQTMWVKPGFTVTVDYRPPPNPEKTRNVVL